MLFGYTRISKADGSQNLDLQHDALVAAGVDEDQIYKDKMSGRHDGRPGLDACLKSLREGDTLVVWKLDRLAACRSKDFRNVAGRYFCLFHPYLDIFIRRICNKPDKIFEKG